MDGVDGFAPGTDAWLRAYHLDPLTQNSESSLPMRAGLIRAAINLETIGDLSSVDVLGVFTAGINGQLPNLDLVNTVVSHTYLESVPVVLDRCLTVQQVLEPERGFRRVACDDVLERSRASMLGLVQEYVPEDYRAKAREYVSNLSGMLRFMKTLATGPSGLHGSFISYNIDAVTVALTQSVDVQHWQGARSITSVLRSLELVVRSLSNLEEKLHQSFFLYVLPNNQDFVSVGEYYYTVVLAISPALLHLVLMCNTTAGMRMAFALAVFVALEALGLITLVLLTRISPSMYPVIAAGVAASQLLVVSVLVPLLRGLPVLSGNGRAREWLINLKHFDSSSSSAKTTPVEAAKSPLEIDHHGWRALKCAMLTLVAYVRTLLQFVDVFVSWISSYCCVV
jgi:GPI-anchor transamidase subunit GAA1